MKTCKECGVIKSFKAFFKNSHMKDGYLNTCKECEARRRKTKKYRKIAAKASKKFRAKNPEKISLYNKNYKLENKKYLNEYMREWHRINRHISNAYKANRRSSKKKATPIWADLEEIKIIYLKARKLTIDSGIQHHVDHIVPLCNSRVCGLHCTENLQVISAKENAEKYNKLIEDIV